MQLRRSGWLAVAVAVVAAAAAWPAAPAACSSLVADDFPDALLGLATLALAGASSWVLLVAAAGACQVRLPGVPRVLQTLLFTGVGVGLMSLPAHAQPPDPGGLPLPDRPVASAPLAAPPADEAAPAPRVTVRPGDSLWSLAADRRGEASTADVAASTRRWHEANRAVIGPDPDLIRPGQVLVVPEEDPT